MESNIFQDICSFLYNAQTYTFLYITLIKCTRETKYRNVRTSLNLGILYFYEFYVCMHLNASAIFKIIRYGDEIINSMRLSIIFCLDVVFHKT